MSSQKGKNKIISLAMESEIQIFLKQYAEAKNVSASSVVRELIQKYLMTDQETTKVVLNIPKKYLTNVDYLQTWLTVKLKALVGHFANGSPSK